MSVNTEGIGTCLAVIIGGALAVAGTWHGLGLLQQVLREAATMM